MDYSILFCDRVKARNSKTPATGVVAAEGFSTDHLRACCALLQTQGLRARIVELNPLCPVPARDACVLVVRDPNPQRTAACLEAVKGIQYDNFTFAYGKILTAHSRHLVFAGATPRVGDRDKGLHTILPWAGLPPLESARQWITAQLATTEIQAACILKYPSIETGGLSWHGDGERKQTIVYRVDPISSKRPLWFRWYHKSLPIGEPVAVHLEAGDFCIASEVAVGTDFKKRSLPTVRHATGYLAKGEVPPISERARKRQRAAE